MSHVDLKSPDIYELYVGSVRIEVGFRIEASLIKRMCCSISCLYFIATRFLSWLQLSPTAGASTNCAANLIPVPGYGCFLKCRSGYDSIIGGSMESALHQQRWT